MIEQDIRRLVADVKRGRVSRRAFVQTLVALGLTAPMAGQMLASSGVAHAQSKGPGFTPTKRGGGGPLNVVMTVLQRNGVAGANLRLRGMDLTPWDSTMWRLPHWHKA